ncbi:ulp1 protease family, C-terminal catalytic domain-containing protein [Tanacetum coccineum]|uniref:Ulp1 protease family, C-terminal catalytic domain-containing protein n=1 Tax=Tanacetum coccineum TaxID=301880 RepID=A0ABQ4XLY6_9ASTR
MGSRIKANEGSSLDVYDAKVSARSRLYLLKTIGSKLAFKPERYKKFRSTVFGLWLDIRIQEHDNHLINYLLQHQRNVKDPSTGIPFIFDIGPNTIEFGRRLVDDLSSWNDFPWGEYMWIKLHKRVYNNDSKYRERHLKKLAIMGPTFMPTYTLQGFVFSFKIWLLKTYPNSKTWWVEEKNVIPRAVAWSDGTPFLKNDYDRLFLVRNRLRTLTPSSDEMKQKWWRMSLEYFHNVSKAKVHREVDVRINVHHNVEEGLSVPDVHHDVEEGLSVPELLKKIADMQRDFQSRLTAVEQFVNHHKTSKIGSDSHVTNVFSNSMEFDHHDFGSLTENPHNRVALMKKITDMEVEFQRRITSIEDFLKIPRSPNLEKTSNVAAECMSIDKNTSNVAAECMSVDKNPLCGSDVKAENKESTCADSFVKTSCATDINANNVHNDSMDFDHDPKVVEQNEFDQNVAYKNLIHDFDQTVEWKILLNDEVSSKNCVVPLVGAEKIAVDALMKIINFDIPKESHTCDSVEEANDAKVQQEAKASKYHVSPYMIQPKSTQQNHKVRARNKKVKKRGLPLTAHDGKVIQDWKEMPCCYVDGVTYGVPWFSESVEKVYFPINAEDNHWILAEFHIRSGVITFYDSLPPENLIVEDRKWWLYARQVYADKLPKLLIQSEVMEKKSFDPINYSISYRHAVNVP